MDDVIRLLKPTYRYDEYGNEIPDVKERPVFCRVNSVGRNEFYAAAQNNLRPSFVFVLSHYMDYEGETELMYTDWTGKDKRYTITRTYRNGDELELTAEERIGDYAASN